MGVEVVIEDPRWNAAGIAQIAERAATATLAHLGLDPQAHDIVILACDDARIAALNADFRGKPRPTNVLSWPSAERAAARSGARPAPPRETALGDIAIAYETCAREAAERGIPLAAHAAHLVVHGILHLLGYDHIRDLDATLMEELEGAILGKLGIDDPYREG